MKKIGFLKSTKFNEKRRSLLPKHIQKVNFKEHVFIEKGYGEILGISDEEYKKQGVEPLDTQDILSLDVIVDAKIGDSSLLKDMKNQMVFGYIHAVQNRGITETIVRNKLTALAWEDMYDSGQHVFWENNQLAGEAAILHAFIQYGKKPEYCNVALLGKGNIARGAYKILTNLGANIEVYDRNMEELLRKKIDKYDVIVNGVLWDTLRTDHIIYKEDLRNMKSGSMIIDISCDEAGAVETSRATSIDEPTYITDNVLHYVVDHTPSVFYKNATDIFSKKITNYLDYIIESKENENKCLKDSIIIKNGNIIDDKILKMQMITE